jgi:hypothetical protein
MMWAWFEDYLAVTHGIPQKKQRDCMRINVKDANIETDMYWKK